MIRDQTRSFTTATFGEYCGIAAVKDPLHAFTHNGIAFVKMKVAEDYDAT